MSEVRITVTVDIQPQTAENYHPRWLLITINPYVSRFLQMSPSVSRYSIQVEPLWWILCQYKKNNKRCQTNLFPWTYDTIRTLQLTIQPGMYELHNLDWIIFSSTGWIELHLSFRPQEMWLPTSNIDQFNHIRNLQYCWPSCYRLKNKIFNILCIYVKCMNMWMYHFIYMRIFFFINYE